MIDLNNQFALEKRMKKDWDNRVSHDYRYWMSDGVVSDDEMWKTGERDVQILFKGIDSEVITKATVLEVGCGVGRIVNAVADLSSEVIGIDVSEKAIEQALSLNTKPNTTFLVGSGTDLHPLHDSSVDIGISFAALGSTPSLVTAIYLSELARVIKVGGQLRIQVYLGEEQDIAQEDTLALRSYKSERFFSSLKAAGFDPNYCEELVLPFDVSDHERGIVAHIVGAVRLDKEPQSIEDIHKSLRSNNEKILGEKWKGSFDAHLVALARVKQNLDKDDIDQAKLSLEVALSEYSEETEEIRKLKRLIEDKSKALKINNNDTVSIKFASEEFPIESVTPDGVVMTYKGVCLSHNNSPIKAADAWAKRALKDAIDGTTAVVIIGLGDGHFIRAFRKIFNGQIYVYENDSVLIRNFDKFDLENCKLITDERKFSDLIKDSVSCVSIPAVPFYNREMVEKAKLAISSKKFANILSPKIGIVGPFAGGTLPIAGYLQRAFSILGSEVHYIDLSSFNSTFQSFSKILQKKAKQSEMENSFIDLVSNLVLNFVEEKNLDFVLSVAQAPLSLKVLAELRNRGVVTAHWFMEDTRRFHSWKQVAQSYDYFYVIQKGESMQEIIDAGGKRVTYLPLACDPLIHRPMTLSKEETEEFGSKISFVGAGYNNRRHVFSKYSDLDFKIWGTEWPDATPFDRLVQRQGNRISVEDYVKIFNSSTINLNLHSSQERDGVDPSGDFVNPRVFELAAAGAFQLSDNRSLLPELLEVGSEIITFDHEHEIRPLISKYLNDEEARNKVVTAARLRVLNEHTYSHRMSFVLEQLVRDFGDHLLSRANTSPWQRTLKSVERFPDLKVLLEKVKEKKLEPTLDNLVEPIVNGKNVLNDVEQKLLFMHHMKGQISQIQKLRNE